MLLGSLFTGLLTMGCIQDGHKSSPESGEILMFIIGSVTLFSDEGDVHWLHGITPLTVLKLKYAHNSILMAH